MQKKYAKDKKTNETGCLQGVRKTELKERENGIDNGDNGTVTLF